MDHRLSDGVLAVFAEDRPWFGRASGLLIVAFVFTPYFGHVAFLYLFGYLLSPLWTGRVDAETAGKEARES